MRSPGIEPGDACLSSRCVHQLAHFAYGGRDSNSHISGYEPGALTIELPPQWPPRESNPHAKKTPGFKPGASTIPAKRPLVRDQGIEPCVISLWGSAVLQLGHLAWSSREDLNLRSRAPEARVLPGWTTTRWMARRESNPHLEIQSLRYCLCTTRQQSQRRDSNPRPYPYERSASPESLRLREWDLNTTISGL